MSWERVSGTPNTIRFYYFVDALYDAVNWRTLYRAMRIRKENGEDMVDELSLQEDERQAFNEYLRNSLYDVFDIVAKQTSLVEDAIIENIEIGSSTSNISDAIGFYIEDRLGYKYNKLDLVDKSVKEWIKNDVMLQFYDNIGLPDEAARVNAMRIKWDTKLRKNLFYLKLPSSF